MDQPPTDTIAAKRERLRRLQQLDAAARQRAVTADGLKIARARLQFQAFCESVLKDQEGNHVVLSPMHLAWIDHLYRCWTRGLICLILAPFASGKSTIIAIGVPLFIIGLDPRARIKVVSASDYVSGKRLITMAEYIQNDPDYRRIFPNVRPHATRSWTQHELTVERPVNLIDPTVQALGICTSEAVGGRSDFTVFDDICDVRNTITYPKLRDMVWYNYLNTYLGRREPWSRVVGILTRYHDDDTAGRILDDAQMRKHYGFLVQRVSEDFAGIDCEYYYPDGETTVRAESPLAKMFALHDRGALDSAYELQDALHGT